MRVAVGGIDVKVDIGIAVSVSEATVTAGAHEVKMRAMSKAVLMFFTFMDTFFLQWAAQWFALPAAGGMQPCSRNGQIPKP